VLSGTLLFGLGDKLAPASAKPLPAGSLVVAPAETNHFVRLAGRPPVRLLAVRAA
jgi:hypothetical protein